MKKLLSFLLLCFIVVQSYAQPSPSKLLDRIAIDLTWNTWMNTPTGLELESIKNRGINIMSYIPLNGDTSYVIFATGLGISNNNTFTNAATVPYAGQGQAFSFDTSGMIPLLSDSLDYKKNKLSLTYLEIPLQMTLRFSKEEKTPKITLGFKAGILIDSHTKLKNDEGIFKEKRINDVNLFRYGPYARLGFNNTHIYGFYGLSPIFNSENAPTDMNQLTIGISFSGL